MKKRVFISSVQKEFAEERLMLFDYLMSDPLLGLFFEPFIFEKMPAVDHSVTKVYLNEVDCSDIYLGLFGQTYGYRDSDGISPTEREFDYAKELHKTKLVFISNHQDSDREKEELALIKKAENAVVRKSFSNSSELKAAVYTSLVRYLEENEFIRTSPFDATLNKVATKDDIDPEKIFNFISLARKKRNFGLTDNADIDTVLTHLNLFHNEKYTNAAILLFGRSPQDFFLSSHIKCAHFHGIEVTKPIPSYQTYKGDIFQLVDQAVDFVLSKIDLEVGDRSHSTSVSSKYEIPYAAVSEAIVNAIAHRDYTSNASVQVMLFKDRLEITNPGRLPYGLTTEKLKKPHSSIPANLLLSEPMYLAGYIERIGTGTGDIVRWCTEAGLPHEPEFIQEEFFKVIIWRKNAEHVTSIPSNISSNNTTNQSTGKATDKVTGKATDKVTGKVTGKATGKVTGKAEGKVTGKAEGKVTEDNENKILGIKRVVQVIDISAKREEIQEALNLRGIDNFFKNYLNPALEKGYIELVYPDAPRHPEQAYRLTKKGQKLKKSIKATKNKNRLND